ncbi:MAG: hypothetical protein PHI12_06655 [Dehalococcoidales bacterium]|nr:hypothetical protein [Dehalococcoidales bacterium]
MANHYNLAFVEETDIKRFPRKAQGMSDAEYQKMFPNALMVYNAPSVQAEGMWSGKKPLPKIGDKVTINFNQLGTGIVESYFIEDEWLGVRVRLDNEPEWHKKQNPGRPYALVFGLELDPVEATVKGPLYPHVPNKKQVKYPHRK